jgi:hypothetical protein
MPARRAGWGLQAPGFLWKGRKGMVRLMAGANANKSALR